MDDIYPRLLEHILAAPEVAPRGKKTRESLLTGLTLADPLQRFVTLPSRKANHTFALMEALQLVAGINDPEQQIRYNSQLREYLNPHTKRFDGAYGPRIRDQVQYIRDLLRKDPDTRQAVITVYGPQDQHESLDVPCTILVHFLIRDGLLNLIVYYRSNDVWWGVPYDVFQWTALQEAMANWLGIQLGTYTQLAGSMHLYEPFYEKAEALVKNVWDVVYESQPGLFVCDPEIGITQSDIIKLLAWEERVAKQLISSGAVKSPAYGTPSDEWGAHAWFYGNYAEEMQTFLGNKQARGKL